MSRHPKNKTFTRILWVSFSSHVFLLAISLIFSGLWFSQPDVPYVPSSISVEMVSLTGSFLSAKLTKEETHTPTATPPEPIQQEKTVVLPIEKTPLAPKVTETLSPPPKKNRILSTLDEIDDMPSKKSTKTNGQNENVGSSVRRSINTGGGDGRPLTLEDLYRLEIARRVEQKWVVSDQLIGRRKLILEMRFKVLPNGELGEMWMDRKSGNNIFDTSTEKALLKAAPFPAHPDGVNKSYILVLLRFTPEGISDIKK